MLRVIGGSHGNRRGHREVGHARAREAAVVAAAARPGVEDDRWGSCVSERGRGGWLGRPKAEA
jgi:hypothetical protein